MRKPLIAGNWKMNKTLPEAVALARSLRRSLEEDAAEVEVLVCPPFTALAAVIEVLRGGPIGVGAQDMHFEKEGAFTGAISGPMLRDLGCSHVIVGHSERRQIFGETDDQVARKTQAAFDHGLVPIVCVGETLAERDGKRTLEVVERQLSRAVRDLSPQDIVRTVIAYEPVWAIGTGRAATAAQAQEVHAFIRQQVSGSHGEKVGSDLRILYGGSVKPGFAPTLMAEADIDGALVGGACLKAESFLGIIRYQA